MGKELFADSSGSDTEVKEFKTNKDYAKSYNRFREKELLKKLKDRNKSTGDSSSSDDSESSDDDVAVNPEFDQEFYKALASLKSKDPKIYDNNERFFETLDKSTEEGEAVDSKQRKKQKAFTIKDYERKVILEKGGKYEDDASDEETNEKNERAGSPSYMEEQRKIRQQLKNVVNSDSEEEGFGGIFRKREKSKQEKESEENEFSNWLSGQEKKNIGESAKALKPLKEYWSDPKLSRQEQFLRDYVLNNGYQGKDDEEIPTYDEIVGDFSDDEKELEKQAEFEHKFNFRFEEPDQDFIKRYPRTIDSSVRQKDDRRREKRLEVKERREKEKDQKLRELGMLKELKRKEILEKIEKLKEVTGNEELPFKEEELEEDFDPAAYDRRMKEVFNDEFYGLDEDEEKPECPDIEELKVEDWDNYDPAKDAEIVGDDYEPHCDDDDFNMDCDYDPEATKKSLQNELIESTKSRRKRKRRNPFMELIKKEKPAFNPDDEKTYAEYIDEYYKMDYEDMIGDQPCRFKYVETVPNDFGLTLEEMLLAKNKELNQWVSLKKAVQIRPEYAEVRDRKLYRMKAKNEALKRKIFVSLYGPPSEDEEDEIKMAKKQTKPEGSQAENGVAKKKKKKRKKKKSEVSQSVKAENNKPVEKSTDTENAESKKKKKKRKKGQNATETSTQINASSTNGTELKSNPQVNPEENIELKKKKKNSQNPFAANKPSTSGNVSETKNIGSQTRKSTNSELNRGKSQNKVLHSKQNCHPNRREKNDRHNFKENKTKFKAKNHQPQSNDLLSQISDERLRAYGINPRKFRKQQAFQNRQQAGNAKQGKKKDKGGSLVSGGG